jgi:photosystem II stability/assembly factor-like uncharacterized protein
MTSLLLAAVALAAALPVLPAWTKLAIAPYRGKQDDVHFVDARHGWYGNGAGKIFRTTDGGTTWTQVAEKPGTFVRAVGFVDTTTGFAGNIGTEYFPGVTDTIPLYRTDDGGVTWTPVPIPGPPVKGLCAIDVLHVMEIEAGHPAPRTIVHAAGRVGGPAWLLRSLDGGRTWATIDMNPHCAMILDVKFFDAMNGLVCAGTDAAVERSHALILATNDGGRTWSRRYESTRPYELTWKASFPTRSTGYVTVQSYDPDSTQAARFVARTVDGGRTWVELPLVINHKVREFGVGFATPDTGWVGAAPHGFATTDGGRTWTRADMGNAVNKIRVLRDGDGWIAWALGAELHRLELRPAAQR